MEIRGEQLQIAYGDYVAVADMDIHVQKGMITSIIGPNGSGKSTVLKGLTRLLGYKSGAVYLDERDLKEFSTKELARRIGVLPQIHSAPPDFQVKELVGYGRMPYQKWYQQNSDEDKRIIDWAMKATGVWHLREKSINECSGGEKQRVWIATVLTQQPEIEVDGVPFQAKNFAAAQAIESTKLNRNFQRMTFQMAEQHINLVAVIKAANKLFFLGSFNSVSGICRNHVHLHCVFQCTVDDRMIMDNGICRCIKVSRLLFQRTINGAAKLISVRGFLGVSEPFAVTLSMELRIGDNACLVYSYLIALDFPM